MSTKPRTEKRTMTQQGLGNVAAPDARRTTMRERVDEASEEAAAPAPISAPPPSVAPVSRGAARLTRSLESAAPTANAKTSKPVPSHDDRTEPGDPRSERAARGARTPIEVTQVDTNRLVNPSARSADTKPSLQTSTAKPPGGARINAPRSTPPASTPPASRPPGSQRYGGGFGSEETSTGTRPIAGRPAGPATLPSRPAAETSSSPARSRRMSIREDHVGEGVSRAPVAVDGPGRLVPKLVKTRSEIAAAPIDHRAGFLIAHVDGVTTVQGLVDIAGMPEEEVQEILERLRRLGIVTLR
jgi:hypothetical protein